MKFKLALCCISVLAAVACNQTQQRIPDGPHKDCSCDSIHQHQPSVTYVNLNKYDKIYLEYFKKGTGFTSPIKIEDAKIDYKYYDKQLRQWNFDFKGGLNVGYDYKVYFVAPTDTKLFSLSELKIGEVPQYVNGHSNYACSLVMYKMDTVPHPNTGNIIFK